VETDLFQRATGAMGDFRELRILMMEDTLLYAFILLNMTGKYRYLKTIGEIRRVEWPDNSRSGTYQSIEEANRHGKVIKDWAWRVFKRRV
jgi:hypothetical protein